ncbi:hypothetical protein G6L37_11815 [Agrobacterium rubi]|uniref:hypothetical protein n=1 Tax=Agrobacterium rubi TaxID=28099 RepID=UPI001572B9F9|nr:hypothetical protein [Agrobacterium rubi]NTF06848.1 hypothetical protein [Agrobacterium rubi]NTF19090.1 hypothetical protein [Agrobacterium rubi]NTF26053.1 hypothetical protein [Agrobacterium rubi]
MLSILRRIQPLETQADHKRLTKLRSDKQKPIYAFRLAHDLNNGARAYMTMDATEERRLRSITYDNNETIFWLLNPDADEAFVINLNGTIIYD